MTKYVALLRGITPTNPVMKNEKLRAVFEKLGYQNVISVISSGNIIFETTHADAMSKLETTIETALQQELGIDIPTIVRSEQQLTRLASKKPFEEYAHGPTTYLVVTFLKTDLAANITSPGVYSIVGVYDNDICHSIDTTSTQRPDFIKWLEKNQGKEITTRTWKTVERIIHKMHTT